MAVRVAIVHYWIVNWRGGEKVLKELCDLFPDADIFTHVADPELVARELPGRRVTETFIGRLPLARRYYQRYLPLMPMALEQLDLRAYDLVISSESGPAKGVIVGPDSTHVSYCHSPMRYVWDMFPDYRAQAGRLTRLLMTPLLHRLRLWDQVSAQRVHHYVANSRFVAKRIAQYYQRDAIVIHPPVDVHELAPAARRAEYFLWVGQLTSYKRPDLAIEAFNRLRLPLRVIGDGDMLPHLRRIAGSNIEFLGRQPSEALRRHYGECRALVFPGVEDFGLVPVEAMAAGAPVIAFAAGGSLETVLPRKTGLLFTDQRCEGLVAAVEEFQAIERSFDPDSIRQHAHGFSRERFRERMRSYLGKLGFAPQNLTS